MAKRFTDTELWDREWFMILSCKHKLLIKYLFDKCDVAGIWQPNWALASTYIGQKVSAADLQVFKKHIDILTDGKIFVVDFISFQYGELSENCAPHKKIINILKKYNLYERVLQGYCKGNATLKDMEEEKEEDKDREKEEASPPKKNDDGVVTMLSHPFSPDFDFAWEQWRKFKKEQFRFVYKNVASEQIAVNELVKISGENEKNAVDIIMASISNGWKGLFPLKTEKNGTHRQSPSNTKQQNNNSFIQRAFIKHSGQAVQRGAEGSAA